MDSLSYQTHRRQMMNSVEGKRKGERTRDRLLWATTKILNEAGYVNMRLTDICEQAEISPAAFYLYFENKTDITRQVLTDFVDKIEGNVFASIDDISAFQSLVQSNLRLIESFSANAGLIRCVVQFRDRVPEFQDPWREAGNAWSRRMADSAKARSDAEDMDDEVVLLACHTVGGMVDELMRDIYIRKNPQVLQLINSVAPSAQALAEFVSVLWFRALFGRNPDADLLTHGEELLNLNLDAY